MSYGSIKQQLGKHFPQECIEKCPVLATLASRDCEAQHASNKDAAPQFPTHATDQYAESAGSLAFRFNCGGAVEEVSTLEGEVLILAYCDMRHHFLKMAGMLSSVSRLEQEFEIPEGLNEDFK